MGLQVSDLSHRLEFGGDAPGCRAALILQRDAGDLAAQAFADQPGDSESSLVATNPPAVDIGNTIAIGVGEANA